MDDKVYEIAFQLILKAGDSKSNSMLAIQAAQKNQFEEAETLIAKAENDLTEAHQTQAGMVEGEARGDKTDVNIILVHSLDHLTMALITLDRAKEELELCRRIYALEQLVKERN